jgi:hypothetical protein
MTNQFMQFGETTAVYSKNNTKHKQTLDKMPSFPMLMQVIRIAITMP